MRLFFATDLPGDNPAAPPASASLFSAISITVPGPVDPGSVSLVLASPTGYLFIPPSGVTITPAGTPGNLLSILSFTPNQTLAAYGFLTNQVATDTTNEYTIAGVAQQAYQEPLVITDLMAPPPPTVVSSLDWDASVDGPYVQISTRTAFLDASGAEYVHLRWMVVDALLGTPIVLAGNPGVVKVEMAIVHTSPLEADWQAATLVTRSAGDAMDGQYSVLKAGAGTAVPLMPGKWHVYGRLTTSGEDIEELAPDNLVVL